MDQSLRLIYQDLRCSCPRTVISPCLKVIPQTHLAVALAQTGLALAPPSENLVPRHICDPMILLRKPKVKPRVPLNVPIFLASVSRTPNLSAPALPPNLPQLTLRHLERLPNAGPTPQKRHRRQQPMTPSLHAGCTLHEGRDPRAREPLHQQTLHQRVRQSRQERRVGEQWARDAAGRREV